MINYKYHYVYKITNLINGKYYYGMHSTNNLNDGYKGSGHALRMAFRKYGMSNFKKEIIQFFNTRKEASEYEKRIVNESAVRDYMCYNMRTGGDYGETVGSVLLRDKDGNIHKYNNEYVGNHKNELTHPMTGRVFVYRISDGKRMIITSEEFHAHRNLYRTATQGKSPHKDKDGNGYSVSKDDERVLSGELTSVWLGRKHSNETKEKIKAKHRDMHYQSGERNSQYNKCWITKDGINKSVKRDNVDDYIKDGWTFGRCLNRFYRAQQNIDVKEVIDYLRRGYKNYEICRIYGISRSTFLRFRHRYNLMESEP